MINPEKIKAMHDLAVFTEENGRSVNMTNSFFRGDYVTKHMLGSFFGYSICYVMVIAVVILYTLEDLVNKVNYMDVLAVLKKYAVAYFAGLVIYEIITLIVYEVRYSKAIKNKKLYTSKLRRLNKKYD